MRVQKEKDELTAANETLMQRLEKLSSDNGELGINNATLKVQVTEQLVCESHYCERQKAQTCCKKSGFHIQELGGPYFTKTVWISLLSQESVAQLEQQLTECESALVEEKIVSQEKKHQAEQCHYQVCVLI